MSLSSASRGSFKKLWKDHFGEDLTDIQAEEYGSRLLRVVSVLVDPKLHERERAPP